MCELMAVITVLTLVCFLMYPLKSNRTRFPLWGRMFKQVRTQQLHSGVDQNNQSKIKREVVLSSVVPLRFVEIDSVLTARKEPNMSSDLFCEQNRSLTVSCSTEL